MRALWTLQSPPPTFEVDLAIYRGLAQSEKSVHFLLGHFLAAGRQHALEDFPVEPARLVQMEGVDEGALELGPCALHAPRSTGDERAEGGEVDCRKDSVDSHIIYHANQTVVRGIRIVIGAQTGVRGVRVVMYVVYSPSETKEPQSSRCNWSVGGGILEPSGDLKKVHFGDLFGVCNCRKRIPKAAIIHACKCVARHLPSTCFILGNLTS